MFNSIFSTHRDRLGSMRGFLKSLSIAAKYVDKNSFEVIISDLGNDVKIDGLINSYKSQGILNIKHLKNPCPGLFWKSKALNHAVLNAEGTYVTMIDIDAVVPPFFLKGIEDFYQKKAPRPNVKLAHRVRFLDSKHSKHISKRDFGEEYIKQELIGRWRTYRLAWERYTIREHRVRKLQRHQLKWMEGEALGNSHSTMLREDYMAIGGYDERFVGWSCEDMDFNRRAYMYLGGGYMRQEPIYTVFSLWHTRNSWMSSKNTRKNERLYETNKKNNIVKIPIKKDWGKF